MPAGEVEEAEGPHQAHDLLDAIGLPLEERERPLKVAPLSIEEVHPIDLLVTPEQQDWARPLAELEMVLGMEPTHLGHVHFAVLLQKPFGGEMADDFQQRVPHRPGHSLRTDEALVDERAHDAGDLGGLDALGRAHDLRPTEVKAVDEHRQPSKHRTLGTRQHVVGPLDHGVECLLAREGVATPTCEQAEAIIETAAEVGE